MYTGMESVMIMTTPPSRGIWSRKGKREVEETSPSSEAVSEKNLKETAPMFLARWKTMAYKGNSMVQGLVEVLVEMEASTTPAMEKDFTPHKANAKKSVPVGRCGK